MDEGLRCLQAVKPDALGDAGDSSFGGAQRPAPIRDWDVRSALCRSIYARCPRCFQVLQALAPWPHRSSHKRSKYFFAALWPTSLLIEKKEEGSLALPTTEKRPERY